MNYISKVEKGVDGKVHRVEATYEGVVLSFREKDGLPVQASRRFPVFMRNIDFVFPAGVYSEIICQVHGVMLEKKKKPVQLSLGV